MDELSRYLQENYPNNYITGGDDCNLLIWGIEGEDQHTIKLCSLMVGLEYDPYKLPEAEIRDILNTKMQDDFTYQKLAWYGSEFEKKTHLLFSVIVYPSMRSEFQGQWENSKSKYDPEQVEFYFVQSLDPFQGMVMKGAGLRAKIYDLLDVRYVDTGTSKEKNKSLADYFHMWSRDSLSRHIVKFDLDGFIFGEESGRSALVEFKRSTQFPWIPDWYPKYDKPDYILQYTFAQMIGADFWLLHHERRVPLEEGYVSFFDIDGIDESEPEYFLRFRKRAMKIPLHGDKGLDSIIRRFIAAQAADGGDGLYCPLCGSLVRKGQYGYYCTGKMAGICDMNIGKHFAYVLDKDQLCSLLAGIPVSYSFGTRDVSLTPRVELNEYNGKTSHRWKKV